MRFFVSLTVLLFSINLSAQSFCDESGLSFQQAFKQAKWAINCADKNAGQFLGFDLSTLEGAALFTSINDPLLQYPVMADMVTMEIQSMLDVVEEGCDVPEGIQFIGFCQPKPIKAESSFAAKCDVVKGKEKVVRKKFKLAKKCLKNKALGELGLVAKNLQKGGMRTYTKPVKGNRRPLSQFPHMFGEEIMQTWEIFGYPIFLNKQGDIVWELGSDCEVPAGIAKVKVCWGPKTNFKETSLGYINTDIQF